MGVCTITKSEAVLCVWEQFIQVYIDNVLVYTSTATVYEANWYF